MAVGVVYDVEYWGGPLDGLRQVLREFPRPIEVDPVVELVGTAVDDDEALWAVRRPGHYMLGEETRDTSDRVVVRFDWRFAAPI